jgi:hypothetical protein
LRNWNDYVEALQKIAERNPTPCPQPKTLTELDQMRTDHRNPIMHPRVVLTEPDARMMFANGESLIIAMAQEIAAAREQGGVQLALTPTNVQQIPDGSGTGQSSGADATDTASTPETDQQAKNGG